MQVFDAQIPLDILASPLFAAGGFAVVPGVFASDLLAELAADARSIAERRRNVLAISEAAEGRGGSPARAFSSAHSDGLQWRLFSAPAMIGVLSRICGLRLAPTGGGSYTYYEQPGDYLALHRDIVTCDIAVITSLSTPATSGSGILLVYPDYVEEPLSSARRAGRAAAKPIPLGFGDTVVLLGGIVPHEVTPMQPGQERIVSIMCYRTPPDA
jgi:hypothetical protein